MPPVQAGISPVLLPISAPDGVSTVFNFASSSGEAPPCAALAMKRARPMKGHDFLSTFITFISPVGTVDRLSPDSATAAAAPPSVQPYWLVLIDLVMVFHFRAATRSFLQPIRVASGDLGGPDDRWTRTVTPEPPEEPSVGIRYRFVARNDHRRRGPGRG